MEEDVNTVWTDGSRLEDGRVGVGMAWLRKVMKTAREKWT